MERHAELFAAKTFKDAGQSPHLFKNRSNAAVGKSKAGLAGSAGTFLPPPTYRHTFRAAHTNAAGAAVREPTRTGIG